MSVAAATAASFATAAHTLNRAHPLINFTLRSSSSAVVHSPLASRCYTHNCGLNSLFLRRRALRIAAVAEEEAVETAQEEVEAVTEGVEATAETEVATPEESETVEETEDVQVNTKLYFGNLPYHCDSAQLAGIVQQYGTPELVEVLYDRNTGKSRGFAFVTMSNVEDANAIIENLDGSEYAGRFMRVNFADKPKKKEPLFPESEYKLFVGNLSWSATSESLHQMFQQCGNVVGARVLYDGDTGRSRGYGFVCYESQQEMEDAIGTLNGAELEGRAMRVSVADGKKS